MAHTYVCISEIFRTKIEIFMSVRLLLFFCFLAFFLFCPCLCSLALSLRCPCRPHCHLLQVSNAAEWPTMSPFCLSPPVSGLFLLFSSFSPTRPRFSLFLDSGEGLNISRYIWLFVKARKFTKKVEIQNII